MVFTYNRSFENYEFSKLKVSWTYFGCIMETQKVKKSYL